MDLEEKPKRVLHVVSAMDRGGAETLIMDVYRNIDRSKVQFDFVTHSKGKGDFDDEIISLGGKIFRIYSLGRIGPIKYLIELIKIMSANQYLAVHSHTDYQSGFPALAAKFCNIKRRICHSHSNNWLRSNSIVNNLIMKILQLVIKFSATTFCSCSLEAAQFLFGKNVVNKDEVKILKNGIDFKKFENLGNCRDEILQELNIPKGMKIIGHVGRFSPSKNQAFILKVLKKILETNSNYMVLFVGNGPLMGKVKKEAMEMGVFNNIRFLGARTDVPRLMKVFDIFLFPSLFEGFGIVTLEAQFAGTPCIVSDSVPKTIDMGLDIVSFISLEANLGYWSDIIQHATFKTRPEEEVVKSRFIYNGFSIKKNIPRWLALYGIEDKELNQI